MTDSSAESFPAQSSVLDETALLDRVVCQYALPSMPRSCRFLTRGDSDVYRVGCDDGVNFYLKIRRPPVTRDFCEAEATLVASIARGGLPVVRPIALQHGGYSIRLHASEGARPTLVFEAAPPALAGSFDESQSRLLGQLIARVHQACDDLDTSRETLPPCDSIDLPAMMRSVLESGLLSTDDQRFVERAARKIADQYRALRSSGDDVGICHGDLARSNIRIDHTGALWLFDFGAARHKPRADELANVWHRALPGESNDRRRQHWNEFLSGYRSVRGVPGKLDELIGLHDAANRLAKLAYYCGPLTLRLGIEPMESQDLSENVRELRRLVG